MLTFYNFQFPALAPGVTKVVTLESFLAENMIGKLILNVLIPPLSRENRLVTYKVCLILFDFFVIENSIINESLKRKIVFELDSPFIEESCRLFIKSGRLFIKKMLQKRDF